VKTKTWRINSPNMKKNLLFGNNRAIHSGYLHYTSLVKVFIKLSPSGSMLTDQCIIPRIFQKKRSNMNLIVREINSLENVLKTFQGSCSQTVFTLTSTVNYGLFPLCSVWWTVLWKQVRVFNHEIRSLCVTPGILHVCARSDANGDSC